MKLKKEIIMFKKTLVALSLLGVAAHSGASTVTSTQIEKSEQAILTSTVVAGPSFFVLTGTPITAGSTLQLDYSAAPTNMAAVTAKVTAGTNATECGASAAITYAGATNDGKTGNYTVSTSAANIPTGCKIEFGVTVSGTATPPTFAKADVQAAVVTVDSSFTVVGAGVDPSATAGKLVGMAAKDQFAFTVKTKADAEVDVNSPSLRTAYVTGTSDTIVLKYTDADTGANGDKAVYTITGDFSWADNPLTAAFDVGARNSQTPIAVTGTGASFGNGTTGPKPTATALTIIDTNPTHNEEITVTFTPLTDAGLTDTNAANDVVAVALPNSSFAASAVVSFTDEVSGTGVTPGTGTLDLASTAAGAWSLNGASVKVFSVPFGSEVESHSIFVSNNGSATGAVTASVAWNSKAAVTVELGDIIANGNTYLNLISALEGIGEKPAFGRADVTFTVNAPKDNITFTAGYTTAAGRANLYMEEQVNLAGISNAAKISSASADTQATTAATQATTAATQASAAAVDAAANEVLATCVKTALAAGNATSITQSATTIAANQIKYNCD